MSIPSIFIIPPSDEGGDEPAAPSTSSRLDGAGGASDTDGGEFIDPPFADSDVAQASIADEDENSVDAAAEDSSRIMSHRSGIKVEIFTQFNQPASGTARFTIDWDAIDVDTITWLITKFGENSANVLRSISVYLSEVHSVKSGIGFGKQKRTRTSYSNYSTGIKAKNAMYKHVFKKYGVERWQIVQVSR